MATFARRVVSLTAIGVGLPLLIGLTPVAFVGLGLFDLITGRRDVPLARLWSFAVVFVIHEWIGVAYAAWLWVTGGFGRSLRFGPHSAMQGWWSGSLLRWARRLLDVRLDFDTAPMPSGHVILLSRHASMVDAIIPAHLWPARLHRPVHYVLKRELRNIPNIDIYGHRLGNHFVTRGGNTEHEVEAIAGLAHNARPNAGLAIFPEGTYATAATKAKVGTSMKRRGDIEGATLNAELHSLLPPKSAGTLALLAECPDAPVVIMGHTGLEGVAELGGLRANLPLRRPVLVRWWTHERSTIPSAPDEQAQWLIARWRELDRWVTDQRAAPSVPRP